MIGGSPSQAHYGATEFVVKPRSVITVQEVIDTDTYCQAN